MKQIEQISTDTIPPMRHSLLEKIELQEITTELDELPSIFSERLGREYSNSISREHKKALGQFFTPQKISNFMASLIDVSASRKKLRILDPGCGALTLSCSLVEHLASVNPNINSIEIDAFDLDPALSKNISTVANKLTSWAFDKGIKVSTNIHESDFILVNANRIKDHSGSKIYDFVISNPPYFKIGKDDPRLSVFKDPLKGQQNIYSLFLLASSRLLKKDGQLIYIVPRSFTSGLYFQSFRDLFLDKMEVCYFHLFDSRTAGFKKDHVLQENVIFKATPKNNNSKPKEITLSSSNGIEDLSNVSKRKFSAHQLIRNFGELNVIHLPINSAEESAMEIFSSWKNNLSSFGMKVSTGPVVPFRCKQYLNHRKDKRSNLVPLLWLHNCKKMELNWPSKKAEKESWIIENEESNSKTIPNQDYILLRRFSSKDDKSKLVATPYFEENLEHDRLGIENHLNYLYKPNGELEPSEIFGLSVLYNSKLFDSYFRSLSGNTQVSATELNLLPLPPIKLIKEIGERYMSLNGSGIQRIDRIVNEAFNLPQTQA